MWPKMLFDLLPHFARLVPMADKYLSTHGASEKAQQAALAAFEDKIQAGLIKSADAQAGLRRQMQEHTAQIGEAALDITRIRLTVEGVETRIAKVESSIAAIEARTSAVNKLLAFVLGLLLLVSVLLIFLVVHAVR